MSPADDLIAKIAEENRNKPVYILAYHVDYWDRLGWKDTFSDPRYSQRQYQYTHWLNLKGVYTPQIVFNGTREFVGSEEITLHKALSSAAAEVSKYKLQLSVQKQSDDALSLTYQTDQKTQGYHLLLAYIAPHASNKIERGENKGKTLSHVQIVRNLQSFTLDGKQSGQVDLTIPKGMSQKEAEVIGFLQNAATGKISAATKFTVKLSHT